MKKFGFGRQFRRWLDILLAEAGSRTSVNGILTRWLQLGTAVRQGDPLAPLLFTILTDFLIHKLKEGGILQGLQDLEGEEEILSIFADDNYMMLIASEVVGHAMGLLKEFRELSGCMVSLEKSKILCLNMTETPQYVLMIPWVKGADSLTHLGLPLMEKKTLSWEVGLRKVYQKG